MADPDERTPGQVPSAADAGAPEPVPGAAGGPVLPTAMRASDADRERVAEVVRSAAVEGRLDMDELDGRLAAVFAARTYGQLAEVTADLPEPGALPPPGRSSRLPARAPDRTVPVVLADGPRAGAVVAVLSGSTRRGRWTVPENLAAVAVLGGVELDMTQAVFAAQRVTVTVAAVLGSVEIRVPDGVTVHCDGIGVLGGFDAAPPGRADEDGPVLVVRGVALFGGVEVKRERRRSRRPRVEGDTRVDGDRRDDGDTRDDGNLRDELGPGTGGGPGHPSR